MKKKTFLAFLPVLAILIICQLFIYLTHNKTSLLDYTQDVAFVIDEKLFNLIVNQYQHYLYGYFPILFAWLFNNFFSPFTTFTIILFLTSSIYIILIYNLISKYLDLPKTWKFIYTLAVTMLLLNPYNPIQSWKNTYTIAAPLMTIAALLFFTTSLNFILTAKRKYLYYLIPIALFTSSIKIELTIIIAVYFSVFITFLFLKKSSILNKKNKILLFISLGTFALGSLISWYKFSPPNLRFISWCKDSILNELFSNEAGSISTKTLKLKLSSTSLRELGLTHIPILALYSAIFQSIILLAITFVNKNLKKIYYHKFYENILIIIYIFHLFTMTLLTIGFRFNARGIQDYDYPLHYLAVTTLIIAIVNFKSIIKSTKLICLFVFAYIYAFRVLFNITVDSYAIWFIFPILLFFSTIIYNFYSKHLFKALMFFIIFHLAATTLEHSFRHSSKLHVHKINCVNETQFAVRPGIAKLMTTIKHLIHTQKLKTISGGKDLPLLNTCLNLKNTMKKFINNEYYVAYSKDALKEYMNYLDIVKPDIYILTETELMIHLLKSHHYSLPLKVAKEKLKLYVTELQKRYTNYIKIYDLHYWGTDLFFHVYYK